MAARERKCPTCARPAEPRPANAAWPFCSDRCRLADLGRWMGEAYRIPGDRAGDGDAVDVRDDEEGGT
ncbi:MAG: DNA gyrase inhibitor YacG [Anaeromyxobacteraceae bacterium]